MPQPSWEALRAEDREVAPAVILTVTDEGGRVVRRLSAPASQGFHRIAWDLRTASLEPIGDVDGSSSPWESGDNGGFLIMPGQYQVKMEVWQNGEVTQLGAPQSFTVKPLGISPETATDGTMDELNSFKHDTAELARSVRGTIEGVAAYRVRVKTLQSALFNTASATKAHHDALSALDEQLYQMEVKLNGDRTISSRFELTPWSIRERVNSIIYGHWWSLSPVTGTHREAYNIAKAEFASILDGIKTFSEGLAKIEAEMEVLRAPWTPGRVPALN